MNETIRLGESPIDGLTYTITVELRRDQEACAPYRTTQWKVCRKYTELVVCGVGRRRRLDWCFGQIWSRIRGAFPADPHLNRLAQIWERWHLNGMRAGTHEQNEFLRKNPIPRSLDYYSDACRALRQNDLLEVKVPPIEKWVPDGIYRYGRYWLVEELPNDFESDLVKLVSKLKETR